MRKHREDLDLLKGISIVAVVLYHLSLVRSGYLGVDAFLVINGFLIVPKVINDVSKEKFSFFTFLKKRVFRLLPLLLLVSAVVMVFGYWGMLPDDFENLSESVVATNLFSNNILASITLGNYWNTLNDFKPLMHTWYIGILFEFYFVFPLLLIVFKGIAKVCKFDFAKWVIPLLAVLSVISLALYLNPETTTGNRFYMLPSRFFEMALGGIAGVYVDKGIMLRGRGNWLPNLNFLFLLALIFFGTFSVRNNPIEYNIVTGAVLYSDALVPQLYILLFVVGATLVFVMTDNTRSPLVKRLVDIRVFCVMGIASYSIFVWHQPILAFYRYFFTSDITLVFVVLFVLIVAALSAATYRFVERGLAINKVNLAICALAFLLINGSAFGIYRNSGVVRDVPEFDIDKNNTQNGLFTHYNEAVQVYDKDYPQPNGKINVFCLGNSFCRDFGQILLESEWADKINLSYHKEIEESIIKRICESDFIFVFDYKHNISNVLWDNLKAGAKVYGLSTKSFGSGGIVYKYRNRPDFHEQTVRINPNFFIINEQLKAEWGGGFVDMLEMVTTSDRSIRVFTDDHKFISFDSEHLTISGARYYARNINFDDIFDK